MSQLEGSLLQMLGFSSRGWRPWREIALLAALFMELSWLSPWLLAALPAGGQLSPLVIAAAPVLFALLTYLLVRVGAALSLRSRYRQALLLLGLLALAPLALSALLYPGEELSYGAILSRLLGSIQSEGSLLPTEFFVMLAFFYLWTRAVRWAASEGLPSEIRGRFKLGFLLLVAFGLAYFWLPPVNALPFVYGFFFFGWLAAGSARMARTEAHAAAGPQFFSPRWFLVISGGLALLVLMLAGLGVGIQAQFALVQEAAMLLWLLFWGLVLLLLSPFIVAISWGFEQLLTRIDAEDIPAIQPITQFFENASEAVNNLLEGLGDMLDNEFLNSIVEWLNSLNLGRLFSILRPYLLWAVLASVLLLGLYYAGRRIGFWRALREAPPGDDVAIDSDDWLQNLAAAWRERLAHLRANLGRFANLDQGRRLLAAARIRRVYAYLMDLSAELGTPRREAQTPLEFIPALIDLFPYHAADVETISRAYMRVRYGELDETPSDVIEVDRAWLALRLEGERVKKRRKKESAEAKAKERERRKKQASR